VPRRFSNKSFAKKYGDELPTLSKKNPSQFVCRALSYRRQEKEQEFEMRTYVRTPLFPSPRLGSENSGTKPSSLVLMGKMRKKALEAMKRI
jgi:hypothetical protein